MSGHIYICALDLSILPLSTLFPIVVFFAFHLIIKMDFMIVSIYYSLHRINIYFTSFLNGIGGTVGSNSNILGTSIHFIKETRPSTSAAIGPVVALTENDMLSMIVYGYTVKPVLRGHPWDQEKVAL